MPAYQRIMGYKMPYFMFFMFLFLVFCAPSPSGAEAAGESIGFVTSLSGRAAILHPWSKEPITAKEGAEVYLNDEIKTEKDSLLVVEFDDDSVLSIGPESRLKITGWIYSEKGKKNTSYFKLFSGKVRGVLNDLFGSASGMSFETATSVAGVKGSDISVWIEDGETSAAVSEGTGFIRHTDPRFKDKLIIIKAGLMARARAGEQVAKSFIMPDDVKERIKTLRPERKKELLKKFRDMRGDKLRKFLERKKEMRERPLERMPGEGRGRGPQR